MTKSIYLELKRRNAIEPEIGHMKNDGHLGRNYLKGREGDAMNVLLCACGHYLRKILVWLRARSFCAWVLSEIERCLSAIFPDPDPGYPARTV